MPKPTKNQILKVFSVLLKDYELDKITVTMLVKECNISRQTFYYHFSDIPAMIKWGIRQSTENCIESVKNTSDIREATQVYFDFIEESKFFLTKCFSSSYFGCTAAVLKKSVTEYITYFVNKNPSLLNAESDVVEFITDLLSNAVTGQIISSIFTDEKLNFREIPKKAEKIILRNIIKSD